jgi:RHS repeat-associated protein
MLLFALSVPAIAAAQQQEEVIYFHTDEVGSVRMVTDASGQEIARYDYLPFGEPLPASPTLPETRQFIGQEQDPATGLDYFSTRYYASQTGRFTTPDDPSYINPFDPQSTNLYTYAYNNPLRYIDPTGQAGDCAGEYDATTGKCKPAPDPPPTQWIWDSLSQIRTVTQQASQPVADWITAPRDRECMARATGLGGAAGGVAGGIIFGTGGSIVGGAGGTLAEPGGGTVLGAMFGASAGYAQGALLGTFAGAAVGRTVGSITCMASGGSSSGGGGGGNRQENRQFREAVKQIERALGGKELRPDQIDQLHREISKQGYTLQEIIDLGIAMFR